jgi:hypothetical protein
LAGLAQFFGREVTPVVSADEATCIGAGVFAARLEGYPLHSGG